MNKTEFIINCKTQVDLRGFVLNYAAMEDHVTTCRPIRGVVCWRVELQCVCVRRFNAADPSAASSLYQR